MNDATLLQSTVPELPLLARGKVRDIYDLDDALLIVATDRISCFDVVLPTPIPDKGRVLTQMSRFWFKRTESIVRNHFLTMDLELAVGHWESLQPLKGRAMLVEKARPLPIEAVVRGYLSGSAWKEYRQTGAVCGLRLPPGLRESDKLPEPIFTPATKAPQGQHDANISFERMASTVGRDRAEAIRQLSLRLYGEAASYAAQRGLILADTKFEFGVCRDELILIDEVLTPDSSRFWPVAGYAPGGPQPSFDKQYVRDYLEGLRWDKCPPAPPLPPDIVRKTSEKYRDALQRITGSPLPTAPARESADDLTNA
ncbi:MAG: phosphoribosylaminoimidazolesuccinocarboxamide synthase [Verrucomicrobia bacterium]|nr:phosphoribosylaminoimidazolesuccinocarboxamide synthase [Verrucomicrobiota bacterium]